jgi:translation initiation factor 2B subunit (eIF-2B alpha/beta/delta family)
VDRSLHSALDAIAQDHTSGAAELAVRACVALQEWLGRPSKLPSSGLTEIAESLYRAQPAMAPFIRLANLFATAAKTKIGAAHLRRDLSSLQATIQSGPDQIATRFRKSLRPDRRYGLCTYSYSSTVLKAILGGRDQILWVACSEGRPCFEGRKMAEELSGAGIAVRFFVDSALPSYMRFCSAFVSGADAIDGDGFLNKQGTGVLALEAFERKKPAWVLADTSKFGTSGIVQMNSNSLDFGMHNQEVWEQAPAGVTIFNDYFEMVPFRRGNRVLCERGWRSPEQIALQISAMRLSLQIRKMFLEWIDKRKAST